ncbi:MAG: right-handed parallel beta-helix repeat-containing protein [Armatimonadetes bacterium]|nr:right-handed parallel beta-helix repeat-containing protein [Armatimonadota bacterium]
MNLAFWLVMAGLALCGAAQAADFYVSPQGSDAWSGRQPKPNAGKSDGPFATLTRALEAARAAEKPGRVRILVKEGKHFLTEPLVLDSRDRGLAIEAAPGERPILIGGRAITGWRQDGDRFWSADLPEVKEGRWDFRLLVVNGEARPRARLPESGDFIHESVFDVPWMSTTGGGWKRKPTEAELITMRYRPGDLGDWLDTRNAEITVYHMWDESVVGLKGHDPASRTLTFSNPAGHPAGAFGVQKYVVWNVREGMKRPGQWYLDRSAGKVVYWPLPGEDMSRAEALAPAMETIIHIKGAPGKPIPGVTVRGLTLTATNTPLRAGGFGAGEFEGAITAAYAPGSLLDKLTVLNTAGQGVKVWNCDRIRIEGCDVHHTGACGIRADGPEIAVTDNLVHHVGILYPSAVGIWAGGPRARVSHNEVHDTPYSAMIGGGDGSLYESNLIHRAMQELHDGGGIYITFCKNITLRGNVIRDIVDTGGYGASAYYLDEQAEGCLVEGNLSLNVARPCQNHMARNNTIRNNVFITDGDAEFAFARCKDYTFSGNVVYARGGVAFRTPPEGIASMPGNIIHSATGKVEIDALSDYADQGRKPLEAREGTLFADPCFVDIVKGDWRFRPGSPAAKLGVKPLNLSGVGRRKK